MKLRLKVGFVVIQPKIVSVKIKVEFYVKIELSVKGEFPDI